MKLGRNEEAIPYAIKYREAVGWGISIIESAIQRK
jgi:hypothetical protein